MSFLARVMKDFNAKASAMREPTIGSHEWYIPNAIGADIIPMSPKKSRKKIPIFLIVFIISFF